MEMNKSIAILQSSYIPWKGYFDMINLVDEFILFDDVQYTRRDWRNRNKIKTSKGAVWLTIPVKVKGKYTQKIKDTIVSDSKWSKKHWKMILHNYSKAKFFNRYKMQLEHLYHEIDDRFLSQINYRFIAAICDILDVDTEISWSMDYSIVEGKTERLIDLCKQANANSYISGPAAKSYIDKRLFREEGIALQYMDYSNYPEYNQLYPPFDHHVSILDLIFNEGPNAVNYMKSFID
jgi:hypothetical protein